MVWNTTDGRIVIHFYLQWISRIDPCPQNISKYYKYEHVRRKMRYFRTHILKIKGFCILLNCMRQFNFYTHVLSVYRLSILRQNIDVDFILRPVYGCAVTRIFFQGAPIGSWNIILWQAMTLGSSATRTRGTL